MQIYGLPKEFFRLSKANFPDLNHKETDRVRAIAIYQGSRDVGLVCRTFGVSRATLYRWLKRFKPRTLRMRRKRNLGN